MKKVIISGFLGIVLAFAMAACSGSAQNTDSVAPDSTANEQCDKPCMRHCEMTCPDSVCLAAQCENCTCPEDSPCHKKPCCKGEGGACCKDSAAQQGHCQKNGEGCKHECGDQNK